MAERPEERRRCICDRQGCERWLDMGVPSYCEARSYQGEIERAGLLYAEPEYEPLFRAAAKISGRSEEPRPRIAEALDFCRQMGFTKIGLAVCSSRQRESKLFRRLFEKNGLEVVSVSCRIGRVSAGARGLPDLAGYRNSPANPLAQAEILNREKTQFNFQMGLCLGHDALFTDHSQAPVSTLVVKDRALGDNPSAVFHNPEMIERYFTADPEEED